MLGRVLAEEAVGLIGTGELTLDSSVSLTGVLQSEIDLAAGGQHFRRDLVCTDADEVTAGLLITQPNIKVSGRRERGVWWTYEIRTDVQSSVTDAFTRMASDPPSTDAMMTDR